jgi:hypothetical protein
MIELIINDFNYGLTINNRLCEMKCAQITNHKSFYFSFDDSETKGTDLSIFIEAIISPTKGDFVIHFYIEELNNIQSSKNLHYQSILASYANIDVIVRIDTTKLVEGKIETI